MNTGRSTTHYPPAPHRPAAPHLPHRPTTSHRPPAPHCPPAPNRPPASLRRPPAPIVLRGIKRMSASIVSGDKDLSLSYWNIDSTPILEGPLTSVFIMMTF